MGVISIYVSDTNRNFENIKILILNPLHVGTINILTISKQEGVSGKQDNMHGSRALFFF